MKTDRDYRLLFVIKVLTSMASIGGMVFIPYALKELGVHESFIGVLMVISACFALPSNFLWSHIGDKYGNKLLMIVSNGVYLAVPVISVISYYSPPMKLNVPFLSVYDLRVLIFIAAFTISSATINGRFISDMNYLLDISPEERRPSYLAFMSVLLAPTSFIPLVGGMIAELISFHVTFIVSFIFGICAYVLMFRLNEPRKRKE
jgi:MFS family permease